MVCIEMDVRFNIAYNDLPYTVRCNLLSYARKRMFEDNVDFIEAIVNELKLFNAYRYDINNKTDSIYSFENSVCYFFFISKWE